MSARAPMERTTARRSPSGLLLVDKPAGPSSFAVVRRLKGRYRAKAGHAGTLDPLASGLLLVLLGPSTRLARYLVGLDKRYVAEIELGVRTATGDAEGEALERTEPPSRGDLEAALARLVGEVELPVPAASAVKVGGERAYRLHRRGEEVEMPVRHSLVHEIVLRRYEPPVAELGLHVGSGTYVRALADVLGGHCRSLRRTAVGPFCVEDADEDVLIPPADALPFLPDLPLEPAEVGRVLSGQSIPRPGEGRARLTFEGRLIAVARLSGGVARPETVLSRGNRP